MDALLTTEPTVPKHALSRKDNSKYITTTTVSVLVQIKLFRITLMENIFEPRKHKERNFI